MNTYVETENLKVESNTLVEYTRLIDKKSNKILFEEYFSLDFGCALIDKNENWVLIGASPNYISIWSKKGVKKVSYPEFTWFYDCRQINEEIIEVLTDPWTLNSAIWELNIRTMKLIKVCEFEKYQNRERIENIEW